MFPGRVAVFSMCPICKSMMQVFIDNPKDDTEYYAKWKCGCYQNVAYFLGITHIDTESFCMN